MLNVLNESIKCISCGACEKSCPAGISGKKIIELYKQNKDDELIDYLYNLNPFSNICCHICPEEFCKNKCFKGIDLQELHKYFSKSTNIIKNQIFDKGKIAIVGGGVSGLTASWYLLNKGYNIDLWDYNRKLGGELNLIPESRLSKEIIERNLNPIVKHSHFKHVQLHFENVDELSYDKIIYCCGCKPKRLDIEIVGPCYEYYDAYLSEPSKNENIAIIGGGKVALDCALHNKGKSTLFIRRNYWDMKLTKKEFDLLLEKKIRVISNFKPSRIETFMPIYDCELTGYITLPNNMLQKESFDFDKVIIAIGKEPIKINTDKGIVIQPSNTVVETVANTVKQLENYFKK